MNFKKLQSLTGFKVMLTAAVAFIASSGLSLGGEFDSPFSGYNPGDSIVFQNDSVFTIEGIQEELAPEGDWIKVTKADIDPEGVSDGSGGFDDEINTEYVWRPNNVDPDWSPYTNGHWRYTRSGWMWISYYSWGWRPYHYGRWWWSEYYGWVWSPGFIFAPAWVVWLINDGYCGWYPISPRVRWHHHYGYRCHKMRYKVRHWRFCEKRKFADPITPVVIVDPMHNPGIIPNSEFKGDVNLNNNQVVNAGPVVEDIEKNTGKKFDVEDVGKYNNPKTVITKLGITDDGRKKKYEEKVRREEKVKYEDKSKKDDKSRNEDKSGNDDKLRNDDKKYEEKNYEEKNYEEKKQPDVKKDEKKQPDKKYDKEEYTPPPKKQDESRKKNDSYKYEQPKDNKDSYKKQGKKKEQYSPPPNSGDDGKKQNDDSKKSNDSKKGKK